MPFKLVLLSYFRLAVYYLELITSIKKILRCEIPTTVMIFYVTIFTVPSSIDNFFIFDYQLLVHNMNTLDTK